MQPGKRGPAQGREREGQRQLGLWDLAGLVDCYVERFSPDVLTKRGSGPAPVPLSVFLHSRFQFKCR